MRSLWSITACLLVLLGLAAPAQAANTLALSFSADPTEDETVTVTVTGNSDTSKGLSVFREFGGGDCGPTANAHYTRLHVDILGGFSSPVGPGAINRTYTFTPSQAGPWRICAYLAASTESGPLAVATQTTAVRLPTGSLTLASSADAAEDEPVTVTVTGTSEVSRGLTVMRELGGADCAPTVGAHYARLHVDILGGFSSPVGPGAISRTYNFTPSQAGTYRICAYLGESTDTAPIATATHTVGVRAPGGSLALSAFGTLEDRPVTVTVTGTSEAARGLTVLRQLGGVDCSPTAGTHYARLHVDILGGFNSPVGPGAVSRTFTFTPSQRGSYRLCAYLGETTDGAPIATAAGTIDVVNDPADDPPPPPVQLADLPAPPVTLVGPDGDLKQADRRPVFRWQQATGYTDRLVLTDVDGEFLALIREDGTFAPTDEDDEDVVDPDDYADEDDDYVAERDRSIFDKYYVERISDERVVATAGVAEARFESALPPGRYRWYVERSVDGKVVTKGETRRLTLLGPKLTRLKVSARSRSFRSSANPGHTSLRITTTPYATVRIAISRSGRERVMRYAWGASATGGVNIDWTCKLRGAGRYRWSVTATDAFGTERRRSGRFRTVTRSQCSSYRAAEREAKLRRERERSRQIAADRRAARRDAAREYNRMAANCAALNGQLRRLRHADGSSTLVCVTPNGFFEPI